MIYTTFLQSGKTCVDVLVFLWYNPRMKFAIVQVQGKQYQVEEGQELMLDRMTGEPDTKVVFDQVLLLKDGEKLLIGQPLVTGANVAATVLTHPKGDKIRVATFKAKSRVRKTIGFRHSHTVVKITAISAK